MNKYIAFNENICITAKNKQELLEILYLARNKNINFSDFLSTIIIIKYVKTYIKNISSGTILLNNTNKNELISTFNNIINNIDRNTHSLNNIKNTNNNQLNSISTININNNLLKQNDINKLNNDNITTLSNASPNKSPNVSVKSNIDKTQDKNKDYEGQSIDQFKQEYEKIFDKNKIYPNDMSTEKNIEINKLIAYSTQIIDNDDKFDEIIKFLKQFLLYEPINYNIVSYMQLVINNVKTYIIGTSKKDDDRITAKHKTDINEIIILLSNKIETSKLCIATNKRINDKYYNDKRENMINTYVYNTGIYEKIKNDVINNIAHPYHPFYLAYTKIIELKNQHKENDVNYELFETIDEELDAFIEELNNIKDTDKYPNDNMFFNVFINTY